MVAWRALPYANGSRGFDLVVEFGAYPLDGGPCGSVSRGSLTGAEAGRETAGAERSDRMGLSEGVVVSSRYTLEANLGEGSFGAVWRARDGKLGRVVALKFMRREAAKHESLRRRFERESRVLASLNHPHVVQVYDDGTWEELPYLVLEYIAGESLRQRLDRTEGGVLRLAEGRRILDQVLSGVAAAHVAGVVHRDLKPENVMLQVREGEEWARVLDFGLARAGEGNASSALMTVGTYAYMSPEQAMEGADQLTAASDVFSLGVLLVELLTGRALPESGKLVTWERMATMGAATRRLKGLSGEAAGVPAGVWAVAERALAAKAEARPKDAGVLRRELEAAWRGERVEASGEWQAGDRVKPTREMESEPPRREESGARGPSAEKGAGVGTSTEPRTGPRTSEPGSVAGFGSMQKPLERSPLKPAVVGSAKAESEPEAVGHSARGEVGGREVAADGTVVPGRGVGRIGVVVVGLVGLVGVGVAGVKLRGGGQGASVRGPVASAGERTVVAPRVAVEACEAGAAWSEAHGRCVSRDEHGVWTRMAVGTARVKFRWIEPGRFTMGSPESEEGRLGDEGPQHEVELTRGFWLGATEVTQAQWQAVMGNNPSYFRGDELPVEQVSWDDVQGFLRRANEGVTGMQFRLPTDAEWEYAARAGSTTARYGPLEQVAWYWDNCGGRTHPVGGKAANAWGLRDMLGNVWEWCADWGGAYSAGRTVDPTGPAAGSKRVDRGGSWGNVAQYARASYRLANDPSYRGNSLGFRLARGQ